MSSRFVLLCEDSQTESFVRRFLSHRNIKRRDIHTAPLPHGQQSGEQWVRTQFPKEIKAIRARQGAWLLIVIDADARTTAETMAWLDAECRSSEVPLRTDDDPVVVAVPKRNIETWFEFLKTKGQAKTANTLASNKSATVAHSPTSCSAYATKNKGCRQRYRPPLSQPARSIRSSSGDPRLTTSEAAEPRPMRIDHRIVPANVLLRT